jgi:predicted transcriptional regulator
VYTKLNSRHSIIFGIANKNSFAMRRGWMNTQGILENLINMLMLTALF